MVTEQVCVCSLNNREENEARHNSDQQHDCYTHFSVHFHAILTLYSKRFHLQNLHAPLERGTSFKIEKKKVQLKWKCYLFATHRSADGGSVGRRLIQVTILEFHNTF